MISRTVRLLRLPLGAIGLALVVGAVVLIASSPLVEGHFDVRLPLVTYGALVEGSLLSFNALVETVVNATPLILVGLAVGLGFKAGLFNIGGAGQFLVGAVTAAGIGAAMATAPAPLGIGLAILGGMVAGAVYGFIPGFLKAYTGAHEVVTTIMLNYVAYQIVSYLIQGPLRAPGASFARSNDVGNAALPAILNVGMPHPGHIGILLPLIVAPIIWWLLFKSTIGFEIRTVGANPDAALYAGMRPRRMVILALTVGGLLAGLAGSVEILGGTGYMPAAYSTNIGFEAITVALLGRAHPVGIVLAGLLLGAMHAGAGLMQIQAGVPPQMIDLLEGVILFFLAADVIVRKVFRVRAVDVGVNELQTVTSSYAGKATVR